MDEGIDLLTLPENTRAKIEVTTLNFIEYLH